DADILAWRSTVGAGNTANAELAALQTMVQTIKSALSISTLSQAFDRFWVPGFCLSASAGVVDLAARLSLTPVNSPTFTGQQGYTGDGSSSYLNTGYAAGINGVNFTQNSASWFIYIQTMETRSDTFYPQMETSGGGTTFNGVAKALGTTTM